MLQIYRIDLTNKSVHNLMINIRIIIIIWMNFLTGLGINYNDFHLNNGHLRMLIEKKQSLHGRYFIFIHSVSRWSACTIFFFVSRTKNVKVFMAPTYIFRMWKVDLHLSVMRRFSSVKSDQFQSGKISLH